MKSVLRPLRPRDPHEHERASTQLELLFDLVIVIAIASLTAAFHHALSEGHGLELLPNFVFLFLAIWWVWMTFTWFASAFDNDDPLYRLTVLLIMVGALIFAGCIGNIFQRLDFGAGVIGWVIMRIGMVALWLRAAVNTPHLRKTCLRYAGGLILAQLLWVVMSANTPPGTPLFLALGFGIFIIEWSVPIFAESAGRTTWHRAHIMERFGLLTIIVLGEALLSIALTFGAIYDGSFDMALVRIGLASLIVVFSLWWIYFAETQHLTSDDLKRTFVWAYGHVFVFASIALLGAGFAAYFDLATGHAQATASEIGWFVGGPIALVLITLWVIRDRYMALGPRAFALPVGALAFLIATYAQVPPLAYAALALIVLLWRVPLTESEGQLT